MTPNDRAGYLITVVIVALLLVVGSLILVAVAHQPPRCKRAVVEKVYCGDPWLGDYCVKLPPCPGRPS